MPARRSHSRGDGGRGQVDGVVRVGDDHEVVLGAVPLEEGDRRARAPVMPSIVRERRRRDHAAGARRPQRSRATRQTASTTTAADDHRVQQDDPPVRAVAGAPRGQSGPGVGRRGGRPSCPSPRRSSRSAGPAWRRPRPPSPNSKASGKANISEPIAAEHHDGSELPDAQPALRAQLVRSTGARPRGESSDSSRTSGPSRSRASSWSGSPSARASARCRYGAAVAEWPVLGTAVTVCAVFDRSSSPTRSRRRRRSPHCHEGRPPSPRALPTRTPRLRSMVDDGTPRRPRTDAQGVPMP